MKLLECPPLQRVASFLEHVDVGEYVVKGNLELYSCKLAGLDKKLSHSLEQEFQMEYASSPDFLTMSSPVGPMSDAQNRRTLAYLILVLNQMYADYDFSQLRAHHFRKQPGVDEAEELAEERLMEVAEAWNCTPGCGEEDFRSSLWSAVAEAIDLTDCEVYSYQSDLESDPFGEDGSLWSFNFFFYTRRQKRILYFSCRGCAKGRDNSDDSTPDHGAYDSESEGPTQMSQFDIEI
ncbi:unnamed protein product [Pedinophyceae sp. YPF-701]|nr:unnamed protein product [Pedinophyceae sp. YPF-701]